MTVLSYFPNYTDPSAPPSPTFPSFPLLPKELQLKIWQHAVFQTPRVITIQVKPRPFKEESLKSSFVSFPSAHFTAPTPIVQTYKQDWVPPIVHVNRDARAEAMRWLVCVKSRGFEREREGEIGGMGKGKERDTDLGCGGTGRGEDGAGHGHGDGEAGVGADGYANATRTHNSIQFRSSLRSHHHSSNRAARIPGLDEVPTNQPRFAIYINFAIDTLSIHVRCKQGEGAYSPELGMGRFMWHLDVQGALGAVFEGALGGELDKRRGRRGSVGAERGMSGEGRNRGASGLFLGLGTGGGGVGDASAQEGGDTTNDSPDSDAEALPHRRPKVPRRRPHEVPILSSSALNSLTISSTGTTSSSSFTSNESSHLYLRRPSPLIPPIHSAERSGSAIHNCLKRLALNWPLEMLGVSAVLEYVFTQIPGLEEVLFVQRFERGPGLDFRGQRFRDLEGGEYAREWLERTRRELAGLLGGGGEGEGEGGVIGDGEEGSRGTGSGRRRKREIRVVELERGGRPMGALAGC